MTWRVAIMVSLILSTFTLYAIAKGGDPIAIRTLRFRRSGIYVVVDLPRVTLRSVRHRQEVNRLLESFARGEYRGFVDSYISYWQESGGYSPDQTPLDAVLHVGSFYIDKDLVSISFSADIYSGGAHPNGAYMSLTFDLTGDTVRRLGLVDLFTGGSTVDTVIADEAVEQIMGDQIELNPKEHLLWNREELRQSFLDYGYQSFVVGNDGIELATWPGAHVMGPVNVTIAFETLDPFIPSGGVLDRLLVRRKS
jgi:hypothetical protein